MPRFHFLRSELFRSESVQRAHKKSSQFTQHLNYSRDTPGLLGASDERLALQNMHNVCTSTTQLHWHAAAPEEEVCWGFSLFVATAQSARAASLPVAPFWCQPAVVCQRLKQTGCVGWSRKGWILGGSWREREEGWVGRKEGGEEEGSALELVLLCIELSQSTRFNPLQLAHERRRRFAQARPRSGLALTLSYLSLTGLNDYKGNSEVHLNDSVGHLHQTKHH